jgi:hypothetical protein
VFKLGLDTAHGRGQAMFSVASVGVTAFCIDPLGKPLIGTA